MLCGITLFALACAAPAILGAIGFSAIGPVAGSIAAGWQASMGSVAAGSFFAFLQSAAMGGAAASLFAGAGAVGAVVTVGIASASAAGSTITKDDIKAAVGGFAQNTKRAMGELAGNLGGAASGLARNFGSFFGKRKDA